MTFISKDQEKTISHDRTPVNWLRQLLIGCPLESQVVCSHIFGWVFTVQSFIVLSITMWTSGIDWHVLPSALAVQLIETVAEVLYLACAEDTSHTHQLTLRVTSWPSEDMPTFPEMFPVLIGRCVGLFRRGSFMQEGPPDRTALSCPGTRSYWRNGDGFHGITTLCFWKLPGFAGKTRSGERKNNFLGWPPVKCMHALFRSI